MAREKDTERESINTSIEKYAGPIPISASGENVSTIDNAVEKEHSKSLVELPQISLTNFYHSTTRRKEEVSQTTHTHKPS